MKALLAFLLFTCLFTFPSLAAQNSTIMCITNQTLQENITVYKDGNMTNLTLNTFCFNDCDNVTMACAPPAYQQNIYLFLLIVAAGGGALFLLGRLR